ncbi:negative regulator GrlR [Pantoea allii]|uniref:GrlR family regulatory protein n=1 Tax=Pantoea allii TaxID=574096 RepID=UPI0024B7FCEE|nr:GrlR family regulatory protein [Pantoea allii]MDJ0035178.1 negative regulator GrlR [Pantoea allii]
MKDGLYVANFQSNNKGLGSGTVLVRNDAINGGDYAYYYQGRVLGAELRLRVKQYNRNALSIFGPLNDFHLILSINEHESNGYFLEGYVEEHPSFHLQVIAKKVSEIIV